MQMAPTTKAAGFDASSAHRQQRPRALMTGKQWKGEKQSCCFLLPHQRSVASTTTSILCSASNWLTRICIHNF
ncbi:hypothetical protein PAHAL_1G098400 [Panicum hallii]|uniref:Uncharacterized protein n=1 Tax=Panicum hallii TaxID=206008 RepID=A0A2T8KUR5_9POAL|nr:hypothetical protein PAHAL_1G098400 [Panicum hallii]